MESEAAVSLIRPSSPSRKIGTTTTIKPKASQSLSTLLEKQSIVQRRDQSFRRDPKLSKSQSKTSLSLSAFALLQYQVQVTVAFSNPRVSFPFPRFRVLLHFHFHFRIETFLTYISRSCIFNSMFFPNLFGSRENERKEGKC